MEKDISFHGRFRPVRFVAEKRAVFTALEMNCKVRAARGKRRLPNNRDDILSSRWFDKSWKRRTKRRKQWK